MQRKMPSKQIFARFIFTALIAAFFIYGCTADAPRDNPFDPINGVTVSGRVERLYTNMPIDGALLTLEPVNIFTRSNANGEFEFEMLGPGDYQLICQAGGFDTDTLAIDARQSVNHTFKLNGIPRFNRFQITTTRISRFFPPDDEIVLDFEIAASDPDDPTDVESMLFQIEDIVDTDTVDQISSNGNERVFARRGITKNDLNITSMNQVVGKEIRFFVRDRPGITVASTPQFLSRIIDQTPVATFPKDDTVALPVTMTWETMDLPFEHTYTLCIALAFGTQLDEIQNIPSSQTSFEYTGALSPGLYVWFLYIVDEFGNRSRSKENPFTVN